VLIPSAKFSAATVSIGETVRSASKPTASTNGKASSAGMSLILTFIVKASISVMTLKTVPNFPKLLRTLGVASVFSKTLTPTEAEVEAALIPVLTVSMAKTNMILSQKRFIKLPFHGSRLGQTLVQLSCVVLNPLCA
jgi:hypothetical protein